MLLELKKRQDFLSALYSILICRSLFRSPISQDALWLEIPLEDIKSNNFVAEVLIVQKEGFYFEEIKRNMAHIEKLLRVRYPNSPLQTIMKSRKYPLLFLSDN